MLPWMGLSFSSLSFDISEQMLFSYSKMWRKVKINCQIRISLSVVRAIWLIKNDILFNGWINGSIEIISVVKALV